MVRNVGDKVWSYRQGPENVRPYPAEVVKLVDDGWAIILKPEGSSDPIVCETVRTYKTELDCLIGYMLELRSLRGVLQKRYFTVCEEHTEVEKLIIEKGGKIKAE